ncbi:uncharacterized protein BDR25DRAFT_360298 [Lindgomyces ingoldianus]|uniref:Uncharacterized protein n=1 Tax=Lindgomyces ingoldianus TaxID=673940 RepID=A0ACB6QI26_9PLEO|nr:uncharacterized protein BDR25DRAFT_360298 [Lindgomyces ingoldianus]KAF2465772.1 hypothetical protein BDR25DRAFT_360298 [Lindgomyces ingoldianus]
MQTRNTEDLPPKSLIPSRLNQGTDDPFIWLAYSGPVLLLRSYDISQVSIAARFIMKIPRNWHPFAQLGKIQPWHHNDGIVRAPQWPTTLYSTVLQVLQHHGSFCFPRDVYILTLKPGARVVSLFLHSSTSVSRSSASTSLGNRNVAFLWDFGSLAGPALSSPKPFFILRRYTDVALLGTMPVLPKLFWTTKYHPALHFALDSVHMGAQFNNYGFTPIFDPSDFEPRLSRGMIHGLHTRCAINPMKTETYKLTTHKPTCEIIATSFSPYRSFQHWAFCKHGAGAAGLGHVKIYEVEGWLMLLVVSYNIEVLVIGKVWRLVTRLRDLRGANPLTIPSSHQHPFRKKLNLIAILRTPSTSFSTETSRLSASSCDCEIRRQELINFARTRLLLMAACLDSAGLDRLSLLHRTIISSPGLSSCLLGSWQPGLLVPKRGASHQLSKSDLKSDTYIADLGAMVMDDSCSMLSSRLNWFAIHLPHPPSASTFRIDFPHPFILFKCTVSLTKDHRNVQADIVRRQNQSLKTPSNHPQARRNPSWNRVAFFLGFRIKISAATLPQQLSQFNESFHRRVTRDMHAALGLLTHSRNHLPSVLLLTICGAEWKASTGRKGCIKLYHNRLYRYKNVDCSLLVLADSQFTTRSIALIRLFASFYFVFNLIWKLFLAALPGKDFISLFQLFPANSKAPDKLACNIHHKYGPTAHIPVATDPFTTVLIYQGNLVDLHGIGSQFVGQPSTPQSEWLTQAEQLPNSGSRPKTTHATSHVAKKCSISGNEDPCKCRKSNGWLKETYRERGNNSDAMNLED